jgi:predicted transposase/invertase (TIGR01784 family)
MMLSAADYRKKKTDSEIISALEEWAMNEEQVREALIEWEALSANKENRVVYEARMKELRDLLSNLQGERRLGREEGREEGVRLVAKNLLKQGMPIQEISKATGLSNEIIRELEK